MKYATSVIDDHDKDDYYNNSSNDYNDGGMSHQTHLMKCAGVSGTKRRQAAQMTIYVLRLGGLGLQGKSMLLTMRRQAIETHLQFWVRPITITSITPNTTYKEKFVFVFSKF